MLALLQSKSNHKGGYRTEESYNKNDMGYGHNLIERKEKPTISIALALYTVFLEKAKCGPPLYKDKTIHL